MKDREAQVEVNWLGNIGPATDLLWPSWGGRALLLNPNNHMLSRANLCVSVARQQPLVVVN